MLGYLRKNIHLKRLVGDLPIIGKRFRNWVHYQHPFDRELGTETSGFVPTECIAHETGRPGMVPYAGAQPSSIRRILARFPDPENFTLVDLGCGKGRVLAVASEFPFRRIVGVELSPTLAETARRNAGIIAAKFPERTKLEVVECDALHFGIEGRVVFFNYHAFQRDVLAQVIAGIEGRFESRHAVFFAYMNPVCADLIDRSPKWSRWATDFLVHEKRELAFGFGHPDSVVVWQSLPNEYPPQRDADRRVVIKDKLWQADLEVEPATAARRSPSTSGLLENVT